MSVFLQPTEGVHLEHLDEPVEMRDRRCATPSSKERTGARASAATSASASCCGSGGEPALEPAGMDREAFVDVVIGYGRELWLWLMGERQWDEFRRRPGRAGQPASARPLSTSARRRWLTGRSGAPRRLTPLDWPLRLRGVAVVRDGVPILDGIDWDIGGGERWAVLGPNGSGKTTLLRVAGMRLLPTRGTVEVLGETYGRCDARAVRRRVAFVSQNILRGLRPTICPPTTSSSPAATPPSRPGGTDTTRTITAAPGGSGRTPALAAAGERPFGVLSEGERQTGPSGPCAHGGAGVAPPRRTGRRARPRCPGATGGPLGGPGRRSRYAAVGARHPPRRGAAGRHHPCRSPARRSSGGDRTAVDDVSRQTPCRPASASPSPSSTSTDGGRHARWTTRGPTTAASTVVPIARCNGVFRHRARRMDTRDPSVPTPLTSSSCRERASTTDECHLISPDSRCERWRK